MKYAIKLSTFDLNNTPEGVISAALGFDKTLSHGFLISVFDKELPHKNGIFKSKKYAQIVAQHINNRGAFGGFGKYAVIAQVVPA